MTTLVSLELADKDWKVGTWPRECEKPSVRTLRGTQERKLEVLEKWLTAGGDSGERVVCIYEAGRYGVWLDRWLREHGVENRIVAPHTLQRAPGRERKTDRLDAIKLVSQLKRYEEGDRGCFSVVRPLALEDEARRELIRERDEIVRECTRHRNRLGSKLRLYGIDLTPAPRSRKEWEAELGRGAEWKTGDGRKVPEEVVTYLRREVETLDHFQKRLAKINTELKVRHHERPKETPERRLAKLKAIGLITAETLTSEFGSWDRFTSGRKIGSFVGLTPQPRLSGSGGRILSIDKAGRPFLRKTMIELAWMWVRWQPQSALTQKWGPRLRTKGRIKRMAIVALARQLLVRMWLYVTAGVEIPGAEYKAA